MNKNLGTGIWNTIKEASPFSYSKMDLKRAQVIARKGQRNLDNISQLHAEAIAHGDLEVANISASTHKMLDSINPTMTNAFQRNLESNGSIASGLAWTGVAYGYNQAANNPTGILGDAIFGTGMATLSAAIMVPKTQIAMAKNLKGLMARK
jgi:hypothetical protein